jgi:hypothetical protein
VRDGALQGWPQLHPPVEMTISYFAYGSNMCTQRLRGVAPSAKPVAVARLAAHELRFDKRSTDGSGKCDAFATNNPANSVLGVVFEIDPEDRVRLERHEKGYGPKEIQVLANKRTIAASPTLRFRRPSIPACGRTHGTAISWCPEQRSTSSPGSTSQGFVIPRHVPTRTGSAKSRTGRLSHVRDVINPVDI